MDEKATPHVSKEEHDNNNKKDIQREEAEGQAVKQQRLFKQHQRYLKVFWTANISFQLTMWVCLLIREFLFIQCRN